MTIITPVRSCLPLSGTINNRTSNYCTCPACPGSLLQQGHITLFITLHFRRCVSHLKSSKNFFIQVDRSCQEASERTATQGRFLSQAELLKLGHFRRFLHSSGLSQLDFLYRVEQLRKCREEESHCELDEFGNPAYTPG